MRRWFLIVGAALALLVGAIWGFNAFRAHMIAEFFKKKDEKYSPISRQPSGSEPNADVPPTNSASLHQKQVSEISNSRHEKLRDQNKSGLIPGSYVLHEKYGRGLVLRREGSGDNTKLTVSFPGFGQKKLIEKYANLQKL